MTVQLREVRHLQDQLNQERKISEMQWEASKLAVQEDTLDDPKHDQIHIPMVSATPLPPHFTHQTDPLSAPSTSTMANSSIRASSKGNKGNGNEYVIRIVVDR